MKEIKFYIQYLAYSAKKLIPKALEYLYAEDKEYTSTVIDQHNTVRTLNVFASSQTEANEIATRLLEEYYPALKVKGVKSCIC